MNRLIEHLQFRIMQNDDIIEELGLADTDDLIEKEDIDYLKDENKYYEKVINKLKSLQSLEEELGIDLITLFKALKDGIYYKTIKGKVYHISHWCLTLNYTDTYELWVESHKELDGLLIHLKDYKKTWALCREELENG